MPTSPPISSAIYAAAVTLKDKHSTGESSNNSQPIYAYSAEVPDFNAIGGTRYWLEIFNGIQNTNSWLWSADLDVVGGNRVFAFPNSDWSHDSNMVEQNFQLD